MMRSVLCVVFLAVVIVSTASGRSSAQAPELLSYQGVLMQSDGLALDGGGQPYDLNFRLYPQQSGGSHVFDQTLNVAVQDGLYNVILSNNQDYSLADVIAENSILFMQVTILADPTRGIPLDVVLAPRQQLASVPYALSAGADQGGGSVMVTQTLDNADSVVVAEGQTGDWGFGLAATVPGPDHYLKLSGTLTLAHEIPTGEHARGRIRLKQVKDGGAAATVVDNPWFFVEKNTVVGDYIVPLHYLLEAPTPGSEYTFTVELYVEDNGDSPDDVATQAAAADVSILTVEVIPLAQ